MPNAASDLFANVPTSKYLPFYAGNELDLRKIVDFCKFSNTDVAKIAGVSESSVRFSGQRIPEAIKERLEEIANICELVAKNFNGDLNKTALWFRLDNPMLGGVSPRDMIRFGRFKKLRQFILDAMDGHLP